MSRGKQVIDLNDVGILEFLNIKNWQINSNLLCPNIIITIVYITKIENLCEVAYNKLNYTRSLIKCA